jgi:hypothetical protein
VRRWREQRGGSNYAFQQMNENTRAEKGEKRDASFTDPTYICRLTDEYRQACTVRPVPPIFVHVYLLVRPRHQ